MNKNEAMVKAISDRLKSLGLLDEPERIPLLPAWDAALSAYGTQLALAKAAGVSAPSVHYRLSRGLPIPAEWARAWHDDRGVPLDVMRPDLWPAS